MSERDDGSGRPFECAKVVIGPEELQEEGNVVTPVRKCMVITVNGEMHTITTSSFQAREDLIRRVWDTDNSGFSKLEVTS